MASSIRSAALPTISNPTWRESDCVLPLSENTAQVWRIECSKASENLDLSCLSLDEQARAKRFHFPEDRRRFVLGRIALRRLAAGILGKAPQEIEINLNEREKPEIAGLSFNLTHSGDLVLLGLSHGGKIGIDVERLGGDRDVEALAVRYFSAEEREYFASLDSSERLAAFFQIWTLKECYLKALGSGLSGGLDSFSVLRNLSAQLDSFTPGSGYVGGVAILGASSEIMYLDYRLP